MDKDLAGRVTEIFMEYHERTEPARSFAMLDAHLTSLGYRQLWKRIGNQRGYAHYRAAHA